jgi:hypothetical protein
MLGLVHAPMPTEHHLTLVVAEVEEIPNEVRQFGTEYVLGDLVNANLSLH